MNAPLSRRGVSPYARRLARERGLALDRLAGSGPNGRIVAADILAFVPAAAPEPVAETVPVAAAPARRDRSVGAFQAHADLKPLAALIAASGSELGIGPFLLKAAARSAGHHGDAIRLIDSSGQAGIVADASALTPSEIERRPRSETGAATMELIHLQGSGIRPVATELAEATALKLVVVADMGSAELLLVHDEAEIPASDALAILAAFRAFIEAPLRLLV